MASLDSPTISDVARVARVSVSSVSRALNGASVTDELLQRVKAAVEEIGYRPQRIHRGGDKAPWLAVLVCDLVTQFHQQVIGGIQALCEDRGYLPVIIRLTDGSEQLGSVLRQLRGITLVGVIALGVDEITADQWIQHWSQMQAPIAVLNTTVSHPKIASVLVNFEAAAAQATQHLLDLGHTRIVYLGDHEKRISMTEFRGVTGTLASRGIAYPDAYHISIPHTVEGVWQGVGRLVNLAVADRPTALFAFDDELAIDVLKALRYYELRVPADISVVGFDNIPMSAHTNPPLTTLDVPKHRIGRQMVLLLEDLQKNGRTEFGATVMDAPLLVRQSTGPAPLMAA